MTQYLSKKVPALDYCKIKRASEILDCSVDDLLYWAEERKIKLCIKAFDLKGKLVVPAIPDPVNLLIFFYELMNGIDNANMICNGYKDIKPYPLSKIYAEESFQLEKESDFESFANLIFKKNGFDVRVDGIWEIANINMGFFDFYDEKNPPVLGGKSDEMTLISKIIDVLDIDAKGNVRSTIDSTSFILYPADTTDEIADYVFFGYMQEKPLSLSIENLYITKSQIDYIANNLMTPFGEKKGNEEIKKTNITKKQSEFTVGILKELGFTTSDLSGSITNLRRKIAKKLPSVPVPSDDKSLIEWLRKGGIDR